MTTDLAKEYTFVARITSKGQQGSSWKLEFDWKLPGSKFPFILYGRDPKDIERWHDGDCPEVTMTRGLLKGGKTGQYASDYFYDLVSMHIMDGVISSPDTPDPGRGQAPTAKSPYYPPSAGDPVWRDPTRASIERQVALKAAVELAGYKIATGKDVGAKEVMAVATLFDRWLGRNFDVETQEEA